MPAVRGSVAQVRFILFADVIHSICGPVETPSSLVNGRACHRPVVYCCILASAAVDCGVAVRSPTSIISTRQQPCTCGSDSVMEGSPTAAHRIYHC